MAERKTIYLCLAHMSEDGMEQKYVKEAFDTNWVVPMGPNVNAFEKDLETFANSIDGSGLTVNGSGLNDNHESCTKNLEPGRKVVRRRAW